MKEKKFLVIIHRFFVKGVVKKGGADYIIEYFREMGYSPTLIEHPLEDFFQPTIVSSNGTLISQVKAHLPPPFRWFWEVWFNLRTVFGVEEKYDFVLAADPLSCFSAVLIKKMGKTGKVYFHSIDYSEERFKNKILNFFYQKLYSFSVRHAYLISFVSLKMGEKIRSLTQGRVGENHLFYLPNSPEFNKLSRVDPSQKEKYSLVYTKAKLNSAEVGRLVKAIKSLKEKYPEVKLTLVGEVEPKAVDIINYSGVRDSFILAGVVDHATNFRLTSRASIGLAWYEGNLSFEKYADSLKIREYAAAGLPTVSNDGIGTAFEMEKEGAGILVQSDKELVSAIKLLFENVEKYSEMRKNAMDWAERLDKKVLLQTLSTHLTNIS